MRLRDEMHMLTGSYAIDALDEPEREAYERHLGRCGSCDAEVRGLRETAAQLARATARRPPGRMREGVLAAAYQTRQLPPSARAHAAPGILGRWMRLPRRSERPGRNPARRRGRRAPLLLTAVTAASLAVAIALGVVQAATRHQLDQARASNAAIAQVLAAPDARVETTRTSVGGTVTVVVSQARREAVISAAGMPALPAARVYELWVMAPAGARPAGLLPRAGPAGPVLASGIRPGDRIGITVEPAGGTSRPTTPPIAVLPA